MCHGEIWREGEMGSRLEMTYRTISRPSLDVYGISSMAPESSFREVRFRRGSYHGGREVHGFISTMRIPVFAGSCLSEDSRFTKDFVLIN